MNFRLYQHTALLTQKHPRWDILRVSSHTTFFLLYAQPNIGPELVDNPICIFDSCPSIITSCAQITAGDFLPNCQITATLSNACHTFANFVVSPGQTLTDIWQVFTAWKTNPIFPLFNCFVKVPHRKPPKLPFCQTKSQSTLLKLLKLYFQCYKSVVWLLTTSSTRLSCQLRTTPYTNNKSVRHLQKRFIILSLFPSLRCFSHLSTSSFVRGIK